MKKTKDYTIEAVLFCIALAVLGSFIGCSKSKVHVCPFPLCPMKGQQAFKGCGSCERGTDCWVLDSAHWINPSWSYDQCEEWAFGK